MPWSGSKANSLRLPAGVSITTWRRSSFFIRGLSFVGSDKISMKDFDVVRDQLRMDEKKNERVKARPESLPSSSQSSPNLSEKRWTTKNQEM